ESKNDLLKVGATSFRGLRTHVLLPRSSFTGKKINGQLTNVPSENLPRTKGQPTCRSLEPRSSNTNRSVRAILFNRLLESLLASILLSSIGHNFFSFPAINALMIEKDPSPFKKLNSCTSIN